MFGGGILYAGATAEPTRQYTAKQRQELKELHDFVDKMKQWHKKGNAQAYDLSNLLELQNRIIAIAKEYDWTEKSSGNSSRILLPSSPTDTAKNNSAWSLIYWQDKKVNDFIVNFN